MPTGDSPPTMNAAEVVTQQFNSSQVYAENAVSTALEAIGSMAGAIDTWTFDFTPVTVDLNPPTMSDVPPGNYTKPVLKDNNPSFPAAPNFTFTPITPDVFVPTGGKASDPGSYTPYAPQMYDAGTLNIDTSEPGFDGSYNPQDVDVTPVGDWPVVPGSPTVSTISPPGTLDPAVPESPSVNVTEPPEWTPDFPVSPSLNLRTVPDAPVITIPEFLDTLPVFNEDVPDVSVVINDDLYRSDLLDATVSKLQEIIANGGVALSGEVEAAIWENAVSRQTEQDEKLYDEAMNFFSSRGWSMPHGAMAAKLAEAHNESRRVLERTNNEITAKQADIALQSFNNALSASAQLETQLMNYSNQIAERALNGQKIAVDALIQVYNAKVARYQALIDGYKTSATVYATVVGAQEIYAKVYESQIRGYQAGNEVEIQKIEAYKAEMSAVAVEADIYKTNVQAHIAMTENERLKVEIFRAQIEAYAAQVNVNTAKYNMYQAQLAGEETKVKIYGAQVQAYTAQMEAKKIEADINIKNAEIVIESNKNEIQKYLGSIEKYKADWSGIESRNDAATKEFLGNAEVAKLKNEMEIAKLDGDIKAYLGLVEAYKAAIQADVANLDAEIKAYMAKEETKKLGLQADISVIEAEAKSYIAEVQGESAKSDAINSYNEGQARIYAAEVDGYRAEASVAAEIIRGEVQAYDAEVKGQVANAELQLKSAEVSLRELNRMNEVQLETIKAGAQISAQLAAGAMGALNASAALHSSDSYSYDGSRGVDTHSHTYSSECNECGS